MKNMFEKGNKITTNKLNCFEIIDLNDYQIVCKDLLDGDFSIFSKTEHKFEVANMKVILWHSLREILTEIEISEKDKQYVLIQMDSRLSNWL